MEGGRGAELLWRFMPMAQTHLDCVHPLIQGVEDLIAYIVLANVLPGGSGGFNSGELGGRESNLMLAGTVGSWALCQPALSGNMTQYSWGHRAVVWARKMLIKRASTQGKIIGDICPSAGHSAT
jgi:hypothetical protein